MLIKSPLVQQSATLRIFSEWSEPSGCPHGKQTAKAGKMQRFCILLCTVVLMLNLADDACLRQAKAIAPLGQINFSVAKPLHGSGNINPQAGELPGLLPVMPRLFQNQPNLFRVNHPFQTIDSSRISSAGGIPL
jgi:hypothetical protein